MSAYTGGAEAADIARLRRMVAEPSTTTYSDVLLEDAIRRYPVPDADGYAPDEIGWIATFDLARAASEVWGEKAANVAANFAFDADGASFQKQQQHEHYSQQARRYHSLRVPGNWTVETVIDGGGESQVGNWNDPYE